MIIKQSKFKKNKNYFINHLYYNKCFNHFKVISLFHINYPTSTTLQKITTLFKKNNFFIKAPKNVELYEILNNTRYKNISFLINSNTLIVYHPSKVRHLFLLTSLMNKAFYISPQGVKYPELIHLTTLYENTYINYNDIIKITGTYKKNYKTLQNSRFRPCTMYETYYCQWLFPIYGAQRIYHARLCASLQTIALSKAHLIK